MPIKYLENPLKCPYCQDIIVMSKEQLETLEAIGDYGFQVVSPTCGAACEVRASNTLLYDADGQVHHANTRVSWNRVETDRTHPAATKEEK